MWIAASETRDETNEETKTMATQTISVTWKKTVDGFEFPVIEVPTDFDASVKLSGGISRGGSEKRKSLRALLNFARDFAESERPVEVSRTLSRQKGSNAKKNPYSGVDWQTVDIHATSEDGRNSLYLTAETKTYFPTKAEAMNARHRYHSAVATAVMAVAHAADEGKVK